VVKELVFRLQSKSELEILIDRMEERIELREASSDIGLGFILCNIDRSLEIQVHPKKEGESFEIIVKTSDDGLENITKTIFGEPEKETVKDASILDIAEFLADLPNNTKEPEIKEMLKDKFELSDSKYEFYKNLILKQGNRINARTYLKDAAERFS